MRTSLSHAVANYFVLRPLLTLHSFINILAVGAFGEAEFWLSGGKVVLIFMLFFFTFITMVGGNPQGDVYGFRNWTMGGAFREYIADGDLGRFEGFLGGLISVSSSVVTHGDVGYWRESPRLIRLLGCFHRRRPRVHLDCGC